MRTATLSLPQYAFAPPRAPATSQLALDVAAGLQKTPKEIPAKYLYDEVGSALFDAITLLPEYGLTRADERLLQRHADSIALRMTPGVAVVELGSGNGRKTRPILEAISQYQRHTTYYAIDGSAAALQRCRDELSSIEGARLQTLHCFYEEGLRRIVATRPPGQRLLVLFLGSNIGNFAPDEAAAFVLHVRQQLRTGDVLLLGADLEKPLPQLLKAYDDPAGVTAAFNLNVLGRINRELDADFDLHGFRHEVRWSTRHRRIEMHLRSLVRQVVEIRQADCRVCVDAGESIWTESSHKFTPAALSALATKVGFIEEAQWIDDAWPFAENFWVVP
jgi:L-histidine N-alpha-methyltransferase